MHVVDSNSNLPLHLFFPIHQACPLQVIKAQPDVFFLCFVLFPVASDLLEAGAMYQWGPHSLAVSASNSLGCQRSQRQDGFQFDVNY